MSTEPGEQSKRSNSPSLGNAVVDAAAARLPCRAWARAAIFSELAKLAESRFSLSLTLSCNLSIPSRKRDAVRKQGEIQREPVLPIPKPIVLLTPRIWKCLIRIGTAL